MASSTSSFDDDDDDENDEQEDDEMDEMDEIDEIDEIDEDDADYAEDAESAEYADNENDADDEHIDDNKFVDSDSTASDSDFEGTSSKDFVEVEEEHDEILNNGSDLIDTKLNCRKTSRSSMAAKTAGKKTTTAAQMRQEIVALHQEMEIAQHGISKSGQFRRKVPREQSKDRTKKRKILELKDAIETAETVDDGPSSKRRLRGPLASIDDRVIQGSFVFARNGARQDGETDRCLSRPHKLKAMPHFVGLFSDNNVCDGSGRENVNDDETIVVGELPDDDDEDSGEQNRMRYSDTEVDDNEEDNDDNLEGHTSVEEDDDDLDDDVDDLDDLDDVDGLDDLDDDDNYDVDDDLDEDVDNDLDNDLDDLEDDEQSKYQHSDSQRRNSKQASRIKNKRKRGKCRHVYRLRNFKSQRLALKHGAALGAHAMGKQKEAIQKLKQVARDAPSAPQIYSSLGLVYENMLHECQRMIQTSDAIQNGTGGEPNENNDNYQDNISSESNNPTTRSAQSDANLPDQDIEQQLDLAKKAYGSYHIAAILCKRDYSLWLRAADCAMEISKLHASIMSFPTIPDTVREYHREERFRWLEEAKHDFHSADNLKPPGIDVPAKLAYVLIELGLLSDALTLLTDLKTSKDFGASYKAWLLYSDLMLRIGYHCSQWNRGVQISMNHMFRRWLRKHSKTFDWKERRLQALCKSLEAACGTKSCTRLILWLKNRVYVDMCCTDNFHNTWTMNSEVSNAPQNNQNSSGHLRQNDDGSATHTNLQQKLAVEKSILSCRNAAELASFDTTTREIGLTSTSQGAIERESARLDLINRHKISMKQLLIEFNDPGKITENHDLALDTNHVFENWEADLPLSASCNTVCSIASELLRHILVMQLYEGGQFVGEAVSSYFKERYHLMRCKKTKLRDSNYPSANNLFRYPSEQVHYNSEEESDFDNVISDDEDLYNVDDTFILQSFQKGLLPPDLKVLYGLCLAGVGGKHHFLGIHCIKDINFLPKEDRSWLTEKIIDISVIADTSWLFFQHTMTQPLGRTAMYAFVADIIFKHNSRLDRLTPITSLYRNHVETMSKDGIVDDILKFGRSRHAIITQRQNQIITVLVAAARLEADLFVSKLQLPDNTFTDSTPLIVGNVFDTLLKLFSILWRIQAKAAVSVTCVDIITALAQAMSVVPCNCHKFPKIEFTNFLHKIVQKILKPISLICGITNLALTLEGTLTVNDLQSLPLTSEWLSPTLKRVALRSFNLCLSTNVSWFSGWEVEEFNVRLIRNNTVPSFFGILTKGDRVIGSLSSEIEHSLSKQWKLLQTVMRVPFDFDSIFTEIQKSSEYNDTKQKLQAAKEQHPIALYGEDKALSLLMHFSHTCLLLAIQTTDDNLCSSLVFLSLSVIVPVTEFCLGIPICDYDLGRNACLVQSSLIEWNTFDWAKDDVAPSNRPGYLRPNKRMVFACPSGSRSLHEWFHFENEDSCLANLINLPISLLQNEWKFFSQLDDSRTFPDGIQAMEKLNQCLRHLRGCFSEVAAEKASLNVAAALIEVAAVKDCQNRFVCIQQSALFASQAPKGGTSDYPFKASLPKVDVCTPLDALLTIGRAGCLQAVHFCPEAAYLCSFVANVCSARRRNEIVESKWNNVWRLISILAYDLSVLIRNTACIMMQNQEKVEDTAGTWEKETIEEFERAHFDGTSLKSLMNHHDVECQHEAPSNYESISLQETTNQPQNESTEINHLSRRNLSFQNLMNPSIKGTSVQYSYSEDVVELHRSNTTIVDKIKIDGDIVEI